MGLSVRPNGCFEVSCDHQALTETLLVSGTKGDCGCTTVPCPGCCSCCVSDV